jgi:hypothetical protein
MSFSDFKLSSQNYTVLPTNLEHQYQISLNAKKSFDTLLENVYPNAFKIIKSGLDINCDSESRFKYILIIQNNESTNKFILEEIHKSEVWINMEW